MTSLKILTKYRLEKNSRRLCSTSKLASFREVDLFYTTSKKQSVVHNVSRIVSFSPAKMMLLGGDEKVSTFGVFI